MKLASILLSALLIILAFSTPVLAKKSRGPVRAYTFVEDSGKASQADCDGVRKVPRKLKHLKEYAKTKSYIGSEPVDEMTKKDQPDAWIQYFSNRETCVSLLNKKLDPAIR